MVFTYLCEILNVYRLSDVSGIIFGDDPTVAADYYDKATANESFLQPQDITKYISWYYIAPELFMIFISAANREQCPASTLATVGVISDDGRSVRALWIKIADILILQV